MKEKSRSIILLFFISLIIVPSFIYGASVKPQKDDKASCKVCIQYQEAGRTKRAYIKVAFCRPMEDINQEQTSETKETAEVAKVGCSIAASDEDINFPYISGYADQTFRPNQPITREELATMLARLITKNRIPTEENQYKDVGEERFSKDAVNYITQLGVMPSITATTFKPEKPVKYTEFKAIVEQIKPYIKNENIELPLGRGHITRAETVVILNGLFNVQCNSGLTNVPFTDIEPGMQSYQDIMCATQPRG